METENELQSLLAKVMTIVRRHQGPDGTGARDLFPLDLWQDLSRENLMGILIPKQYKGLGLGLDALAGVMERLVICGAPMGFALSFMIHHLVPFHFILTHGNNGLREAFLPGLAMGKMTAAVAVSEPNVGAHPKYLTARAREENGTFVIDGEKSFVTNGPMADLFIVLAVTEKREKRNLFSAFVIPRNTKGLLPGSPMEISILSPCPHSTLSLETCRVKAKAITGERDKAWDTMMIPFRKLEQTMVPMIISGAIGCRAASLAILLKGESLDREIKEMEAMACQASLIARNIVKAHMEKRDTPLATAGDFASCARDFQQHVQLLIKKREQLPSPKKDQLGQDQLDQDRLEQERFDNDLNALLRIFPK